MLIEAANPNWIDQTESTKYKGQVPGIFLRRLAGRHGKKSANGANAWTNIAFFDGHVSLYETAQFEYPANIMDKMTNGTIFYINKQ